MSTNSHDSHFVVPLKYYVGTLVSLLVLTFITVFVSRFDFGSMNLVVAMLIASIKASMVALFFMGLKWDKGFNRVILASTLVFLFFFFAFTLSDYFTRGKLDIHSRPEVYDIKSPVKPISPGAAHHSE